MSSCPDKRGQEVTRLHGLIEELAMRFRGYLPWPEEKRDSVVRGHEAAIKDIIKKADAIAVAHLSARATTPVAPDVLRRVKFMLEYIAKDKVGDDVFLAVSVHEKSPRTDHLQLAPTVADLKALVVAARRNGEAMRAEGRAENKFPVLWNSRDPKPHSPQWVPWDWMDKFARRAERNHDQTILRLAERGGLGASEIWCAVHDRGLWDESVPAEAQCGEWLRSEPWAVATVDRTGER